MTVKKVITNFLNPQFIILTKFLSFRLINLWIFFTVKKKKKKEEKHETRLITCKVGHVLKPQKRKRKKDHMVFYPTFLLYAL